MATWSWNLDAFPSMTLLVNYYANQHPVTEKRFTTAADADNVTWSVEVRNMLSIVWLRNEGAIAAGTHIEDDTTYDTNYFFDGHSASELTNIKNDIDTNRANITDYDADNPLHVAIIDNILIGLEDLASAK